MTPKDTQRYHKYTVQQLRKKAQTVFNKWIRNRDKGKPCISCGAKPEQAGHYYSAGHHPGLALNPNNCHGQCKRCNYFLSGNLTEYRKHLIERIGIEEVQKLDDLVSFYKRYGFKHNKFALIEVITIYK